MARIKEGINGRKITVTGFLPKICFLGSKEIL